MRRTSVTISLLLATVAAPVAAQELPKRVNWFFKGLQTGLCVEFLVAPRTAADQFRGMVSPTPVESLVGRYPALARVARDERAYVGWVPAEYCWYLYRSAVVDGREVQVSGGRQPVAVGFLSIAAWGLPDSAEAVVVTLFTNARQLSRSADVARLQIEQIDLTVGLIPTQEESPDERRYIADHGRTTVQWDGRPGTERPSEERSLRLAGRTFGESYHGIRPFFVPDSAFAAIGNLRVVGTGELQAMLAASPIRLLSSFMRGGDADWELGR